MNGIVIKEQSLRKFARSILIAFGAEASEADSVASAMVWSDRMGRQNYGVWRLPIFTKRLSLGLIKSPCCPRFRKTAPAVGVLDGDQGFGHLVGQTAMRRAMELARQSGVGLVCVNNSNHFCAGAYYAQLAVEANMIGLVMSNSYPLVAAFGGRKPVLGTNPLAFGAPRRNGRSVLIDMATSASSGSNVRKSAEGKKKLSENIGLDKRGRLTTDPGQVAALLPFGGAKGFCLGTMVEIFCGVLTGAGISYGVKSTYHNFQEACNNGHFFQVLDIAKFMPLETYYARMETLVDSLLTSGKPGAVRVPGEHRWIARDQSLREGIRLDGATVKSLEALAEKVGLAVPWQQKVKERS